MSRTDPSAAAPRRLAHARADRASPRRTAVAALLAFAVSAALGGVASSTLAVPASAAVSSSQQWPTDISYSDGTGFEVGNARTLTFGDSGLVATERNTGVTGSACPMGTALAGPGEDLVLGPAGLNADLFLSPTPPLEAKLARQYCVRSSGPSTRTSTVTFNTPVLQPMLHLVNLEASDLTVSGTGIGGAPMTPTVVSRNARMSIAGATFNSALSTAEGAGCELDDGSNGNGACASVLLATNNEPIQRFTMINSTEGSTLSGHMDDGWGWSASFPTAPLTQAFSPALVETGGISHLTFTITNPANPQQPTLAPLGFDDDLPTGLVVANNTVTMTGCGPATTTGANGTPLIAGATRIEVRNATLPAGTTCQVTVDVTAPTPGTYRSTTDDLSPTVANLIPHADTSVTFQSTAAELALEKTVDLQQFTHVGQLLTYTFAVRNTGSTTLTDVVIEETAFSGSGALSAIDCPSKQQESLRVGERLECTATYTVTQADVDAGTLTNTAVARATASGRSIRSLPADVVLPGTQDPSMTIEKSADVTSIVRAGDRVTYSFRVTNAGNVTLTDPEVIDQGFSGTGTLSPLVCPDRGARLLPAHHTTCTATYEVTQADVDAGGLENSATVTGVTPPGVRTPPAWRSHTIIPSDSKPGLSLTKTADTTDVTGAGQRITYRFAVTNIGDTTMYDVQIEDRDFTGAGALSPVECPAEVNAISPGVTVVCSATYVTVAEDVRTGHVSNTAVATAVHVGGGDPVSSESSTAAVTVRGGSLPTTGSAMTGPTTSVVGMLLIGGGAAFALLRRRRRSA